MQRIPDLVALAADMEAATSLEHRVTPAVQQRHPSACKAWAAWNSAASIQASYNVASITDTGTGNWTMVIATDMSSAEYVSLGYCGHVSGIDYLFSLQNTANTAGGCQTLGVRRSSGALNDPTTPDRIYCMAFGDQ